jgi:hypothetical protein
MLRQLSVVVRTRKLTAFCGSVLADRVNLRDRGTVQMLGLVGKPSKPKHLLCSSAHYGNRAANVDLSA